MRELTGGIYFGDGLEASDANGWEKALDTEPYSKFEIERISRLAGAMARAKAKQTGQKCKVWSLDKANVLRTSRLWRHVISEVFAKEFPEVELGHQLIDSAAMIMVRDPRQLNGVVVTSNLFGDIISDEASVIPGSLGLLPSASLCGVPGEGRARINGIYEPIHGSFQGPPLFFLLDCCFKMNEKMLTLIILQAQHQTFPAKASSIPSQPSSPWR